MKRDVYILHYVVSGGGEFCGESLRENCGYIVFPNELELIESDKDEPYETYWIMLKGAAAPDFLRKCGLPRRNAVFEFSKVKECGEILKYALFGAEPSNELQEAALMNAAFYQIMAMHFGDTQRVYSHSTVSQKVMEFIEKNYYSNISIDSIAKSFNFSRNYLYSLFKKDYGTSPQEYLLNLRIKKAKELFSYEKKLSIGEVALAVGFGDALYFSRAFHKRVGMSPTEFKRSINKKA